MYSRIRRQSHPGAGSEFPPGLNPETETLGKKKGAESGNERSEQISGRVPPDGGGTNEELPERFGAGPGVGSGPHGAVPLEESERTRKWDRANGQFSDPRASERDP